MNIILPNLLFLGWQFCAKEEEFCKCENDIVRYGYHREQTSLFLHKDLSQEGDVKGFQCEKKYFDKYMGEFDNDKVILEKKKNSYCYCGNKFN